MRTFKPTNAADMLGVTRVVNKKTGDIPGLSYPLLQAILDGELGDQGTICAFCDADPKGEDLWAEFERSNFRFAHELLDDRIATFLEQRSGVTL